MIPVISNGEYGKYDETNMMKYDDGSTIHVICSGCGFKLPLDHKGRVIPCPMCMEKAWWDGYTDKQAEIEYEKSEEQKIYDQLSFKARFGNKTATEIEVIMRNAAQKLADKIDAEALEALQIFYGMDYAKESEGEK